MPTLLHNPRRFCRLLLGAAALGYFLRVFLWGVSQGSNDIRTWYFFALALDAGGLEQTYILQPLFNHPPLMGLWSQVALYGYELTGVPFPQVFKLPSLLAELAIGVLLFRVWKQRGDTLKAHAAFAAYALSLSCIVISGYHGNTDAIYFYLAFLAAYLMEARRSPFLSGLALGASLNVKLIPVLLGLPLASRCRDLPELRNYVLGASIGAIPFLWAIGSFGEEGRASFIQNLFMYRSNLEYWGVESAVRWIVTWSHYWSPSVSDSARAFGNWYSVMGGKVLLLGSALLALWNLWASRHSPFGTKRTFFDAYQLATLAFALFLIFGSGFGVQYVGCVVAPLLACSLWSGVLVGTYTGLFITIVYVQFVTEWMPVFSDHQPIPAYMTPLSTLAWLSLVVAAVHVVHTAYRAHTKTPAPKGRSDAEDVSTTNPLKA